jgi:hypothetical protein
MEHLYNQVRPPIDKFELTLINAFADFMNVHAIWVREMPLPVNDPDERIRTEALKLAKRGVLSTKAVWLQLDRLPNHFEAYIARMDEFYKHVCFEPFNIHFEYIVDDFPPGAHAPSCIYRRNLAKGVVNGGTS